MSSYSVTVNNEAVDSSTFLSYHRRRIAFTIEKLREMGATRIVEIGGHPWVLTAKLIEENCFDVCATISAEEETQWPDDIALTIRPYTIGAHTGKTATVTLSVYRESSRKRRRLVIRVSDTGVGVPRREIPHLTEPFFRGENSRRDQTPGSGLGLSLVARIVRTYGGTLTVDSIFGRGTTVTASLPVDSGRSDER